MTEGESRPELLLMGEPFGALDVQSREVMQDLEQSGVGVQLTINHPPSVAPNSATTTISPTIASLKAGSASAGIQYSRCAAPPASLWPLKAL
jgi:ABC-type sulfate/molybdate transport systems ATPase subunit